MAALCFTMNQRFPEIIRKERRSQLVLAGLLLGPFVLAAIVLGVSGSFVKVTVVLVLLLFTSYRFYVFIRPRLAIVCPVCKMGVLRENYANCPPRTDQNMEHTCNKCGSFFVNANLQPKT